MIIRQQPTASVLSNIYDICNRLFSDEKCFYSEQEWEQEKQNENNIFLEAKYEAKTS